MQKDKHLALLGVLCFTLTSCGWFCPEGDVLVRNTSFNTVQRVKIDGETKAILAPGESQSFSVDRGEHVVRLENANSGQGGCAEDFYIELKGCDSESVQCGY
jgi:hypothetical protein